MGFKTQTIPASSLKGNSLLKNPARSRIQEQGTQKSLTHLASSAEMGHLPFQLFPKHIGRKLNLVTSRWDVKPRSH